MHVLTLKPTPSAAAPPHALAELQAHVHRDAAGPDRPVKQLMTWFLDRRNLDAAWDRVADADGAATPGTDGVACADVRPRLADWLNRLADDLYNRRWRPAPVRVVEVPKPGKPDAVRRIGILTV